MICCRLVIDALNKISTDPSQAFLPICSSLNDPNTLSMKVKEIDQSIGYL